MAAQLTLKKWAMDEVLERLVMWEHSFQPLLSCVVSIAWSKEASVGDAWSSEVGEGCWNPIFSRHLND